VGAVVIVPYLAAAALLVAAGVEKVRKPHYTLEAFTALHLPSSFRAIRALGVVECLAGGAAIVTTAASTAGQQAAAALVAILYVALAAVVVRLLVSGTSVRSCGCLGAADTPPSYTHVAVNLACAVSAALYAIDPVGLSRASGGEPFAFAFALLAAVVAVYLAAAVIQLLPTAWKMRKLPRTDSPVEGG
jgi:hypothetical protein